MPCGWGVVIQSGPAKDICAHPHTCISVGFYKLHADPFDGKSTPTKLVMCLGKRVSPHRKMLGSAFAMFSYAKMYLCIFSHEQMEFSFY